MQYVSDHEEAEKEMNQARERLDLLVRSMGFSAEMKGMLYAMLDDLQEKSKDFGRECGYLAML